jgi:hypothetical protein
MAPDTAERRPTARKGAAQTISSGNRITGDEYVYAVGGAGRVTEYRISRRTPKRVYFEIGSRHVFDVYVSRESLERDGAAPFVWCGQDHRIYTTREAAGKAAGKAGNRNRNAGGKTAEAPPANPYADHRARHWKFIEAHGVPVRRDPLLRLGDHWADLNARYFGGAMVKPVILLTPPSSATAYGDTATVGSFGEPLEIRLRTSLLEGHTGRSAGTPKAASGSWPTS